MQNRSRHGFVEAVLRRPAVILAIAATCRKTERMDNVGTIFYTAPVAPHVLINAFFLYNFLGWVMECIVIRREKGRWENRGFAHLPFCIIYGFGAMLGFALLRPFSGNYVLLYLVGCCFSKRMRKVFRKNEKSMLQNCNKKAKRKGRLQRVKKPM